MRHQSFCSTLLPILALTFSSALTNAPGQVVWTQANPETIGKRFGHRTAYDVGRGELVLFGGSTGFARSWDETWVWDGAIWTQRTPTTSPPPRRQHAMAYDAARGRVVLFGGYDTAALGDTWEWDGVNWTQRTPATSPPARNLHAMAYDAARGRVVLFGGRDYPAISADTWEWDGVNWTRVAPTAGSPAARYGHAMAYDAARGQVLLTAGNDFSEGFRDTWAWDGASWTQLAVGTSPPSRTEHAMVYDAARGRVVMFSGTAPFTWLPLDDTWEWDGSQWLQRSPRTNPPASRNHSMSYDVGSGRVVLFGGLVSSQPSDNTWTWDGNDWAQVGASTPPPNASPIAYHAGTRRAVMLAAKTPHTWEFDGTTWRRVASSGPKARQNHALAYDATRDRVVLFGGIANQGGAFLGDTWTWGGGQWTQVAGGPRGRVRHAMAYDSARDRVVLFGGSVPSSHLTIALDETWEFDGTAWTKRTPATSPPPLAGHGMAYDEARGRVVLFGGDPFNPQTWEWDGNDWLQRTPAAQPRGRWGHAMAYDAARERVVVFGGWAVGGSLSDTWEWNGVTWLQRTPVASPSSRSEASMAYDAARSRIVMFGGGGLDETWEYYPRDPATYTPFGSGCAGQSGTPALAAAPGALPWLSQTFTVELTQLPAAGHPAALFVGRSNTMWGSTGLPLALGFAGLPGCELLVSPDLTIPLVNAGGQASWTVLLACECPVVGLPLFMQGVALDPGANPTGAVFSNGGEAVIGSK